MTHDESLRRILGDEAMKIASDNSLTTRGDAPEVTELSDLQLCNAIRGCFTGVALAMEDFKSMASRANALIGELVSRRAPEPEPSPKKQKRKRGPPSEATRKAMSEKKRQYWAARKAREAVK